MVHFYIYSTMFVEHADSSPHKDNRPLKMVADIDNADSFVGATERSNEYIENVSFTTFE